ncbi:MAG: protoheme IX farnesyltransferase [Acidobacteria bacterium]|nr:protoheme IX farnesyltransferase [Acidobacteriota bacterium]
MKEVAEARLASTVMPWPTDRLVASPGIVRRKLTDYMMLVKARLSLLVLSTAVVGFWLASRGAMELGLLARFGLGTFLVIAGANALNQVFERDQDALMRRTASRPLPAGRMGVQEALLAAISMSILGLLVLIFTVNFLTGSLAFLALASYVFAYTPLKRRSIWCTFVGAFPGAIPTLMGWSAARNELGLLSAVLFGILFLWQFPHFWAIAWVYREDYVRANFRVLPVVDPTGQRTGRQVIGYCLGLLAINPLLTLMDLTGTVYLFGALVLGLMLLTYGIRLKLDPCRRAAGQLMAVAMLYLPLLLALMVLDKSGWEK